MNEPLTLDYFECNRPVSLLLSPFEVQGMEYRVWSIKFEAQVIKFEVEG